jgi:hypothetical protein
VRMYVAGRELGIVSRKKGNDEEHCNCGEGKGSHTSLSNFTLALSPSIASSFWPSRSSTKRAPAKAAVSDGESCCPGYGDERPECGGVGA